MGTARGADPESATVSVSLGTANGDAAQICLSKIERALAEGSASLLWKKLSNLLPPETFAKLAAIADAFHSISLESPILGHAIEPPPTSSKQRVRAASSFQLLETPFQKKGHKVGERTLFLIAELYEVCSQARTNSRVYTHFPFAHVSPRSACNTHG